ncbi:hypothetical protein [Lutibacter citreus]|uniref:hypothetical protein n=1 Tax=Lutibacter citreus TaxID=2138210 RepID=UPI000DBE9CEC|nr:hypothetical protein [Lutibacter citreus]
MKNKRYILLILIIFISVFVQNSYAQINTEDTYLTSQYFQLNKNPNFLLQNQKSAKDIQSSDNFINLNQIGNYNEIDIKQKGKDSQSVNQLGNKNYYSFINYYNNSPLNLNILQKGNSNNLQIYGQNSLIKNMSVIQKSNFKTLIIKNYK